MTQLSLNFSLSEFVDSHIAKSHGVDNTPSSDIINTLMTTAQHMEIVRHLLRDQHIIICSGYRCHTLNKLVGGVEDSAHLYGYAADFLCPGFGPPPDVINALRGQLEFDQIIDEHSGACGNWVHISFKPSMRNQILVLHKA